MAAREPDLWPWLLLVGVLVVILFVLIAISQFANAIVTLLLNAGLPSSWAGPLGSLIFWGIIVGIILGVLIIIIRVVSN